MTFGRDREKPIIPRNRMIECSARIASDGTLLQFPDEQEIDRLSGQLSGLGVRAASVNLLNAYANPAAERDLARALSEACGGLPVTCSTDIWPEMREYERGTLAAINAYIHPPMVRYFDGLERRLRDIGIECSIFITASNGGTVSIDTARTTPVVTLFSGPAAGVLSAVDSIDTLDTRNIVSFDMGGTSSDISICEDGETPVSVSAMVGDYPIVMPVLDVAAIGAGGGSIASVDDGGWLKVGPRSAGSRPGPVCYGVGGTEPTLTDGLAVLGYFPSGSILDGSVPLNMDLAATALDGLGGRLGLQAEDRAAIAATQVLRVTTSNMAAEFQKQFARKGLDPRDFTLMAYGGCGPQTAVFLAEEVGIRSIVVPLEPGVFCARGALVADLRRDFVRTLRTPLRQSAGASKELIEAAGDLQKDAEDWLANDGATCSQHHTQFSAEVKYEGQAFTMRVICPVDLPFESLQAEITRGFHDQHKRVYGFDKTDADLFLVSLCATAIGNTPAIPTGSAQAEAQQDQTRRHRCWFGGWLESPVVARSSLAAGSVLKGPVIVEQSDTTIVIAPGWTAVTQPAGHLLMTMDGETAA